MQRALRPGLLFFAAHLALGGLFWWVDALFQTLLRRVGGHLTNLPLAAQRPLILADWLVRHWPLFVLASLLLAVIYGLTMAPPEGKRPRLGVVMLCWLPMLFGYCVLLWMVWAQRIPIQQLQWAVQGGVPTP